MRIDLKGIHAAHVSLADGTKKIYRYAWRGGPRLRGEPGTPDFIASYNEAVAWRAPTPEGKLQFLIDKFQASGEFITLRPRTRADYIKQIKLIEQEFGDFPIKALGARETRGLFLDWRDKLALNRLDRPITLGPCWRASCRWQKIAVASPPILVNAAVGFITAPGSTSSGPWTTKRNS
jgi:hypothetical protein